MICWVHSATPQEGTGPRTTHLDASQRLYPKLEHLKDKIGPSAIFCSEEPLAIFFGLWDFDISAEEGKESCFKRRGKESRRGDYLRLLRCHSNRGEGGRGGEGGGGSNWTRGSKYKKAMLTLIRFSLSYWKENEKVNKGVSKTTKR